MVHAFVWPATCFVWLDSDLKAYDCDGKLLSNNIDAYVNTTVSGVVSAFCTLDGEPLPTEAFTLA